MRRIEPTTSFRSDVRRLRRSLRRLDGLLSSTVGLLAHDKPLPLRRRDHNLSGDWIGYRECHLKPDLLLIYGKIGNDVLRLVRLGSHNDLFD